MRRLYPQSVDGSKTTIGGLNKSSSSRTFARKMEGSLDYKEIGDRLRIVREHFSDLNQKEWAEKHGFNKTQYNNWEVGARRIPVDEAEKLCDRYGLTLDAIYRGRFDGLAEKSRNVF